MIRDGQRYLGTWHLTVHRLETRPGRPWVPHWPHEADEVGVGEQTGVCKDKGSNGH